jgi:hypothetical protein
MSRAADRVGEGDEGAVPHGIWNGAFDESTLLQLNLKGEGKGMVFGSDSKKSNTVNQLTRTISPGLSLCIQSRFSSSSFC